MTRIFYLSLSIFMLLLPLQADLLCTHCDKKITGKYLLNKQKKAFCSRSCFSSTLPSCTVCQKAVSGPYKLANDKPYCSNKCLNTILPTCSLCAEKLTKVFNIKDKTYCSPCVKLGRCFACELPARDKISNDDGRVYCRPCSQTVVFDPLRAGKIYREAVKLHDKLMGRKKIAVPDLKFVDMKQLEKHGHSNAHGMSLRGYYQEIKEETTVTGHDQRVVSKTVEKVGEFIYLLDGVKDKDLLVTAVHELTHDWLSDYYPGIKVAPLWLEEGFCQYVAHSFCIRQKYHQIAEDIKNAPDEVYGRGVRFYLKKFGDNNIPAVYKWFVTQQYHLKPADGVERKD